MANKNLKSIKFPDLPDTYIIPQGTVTEADLEESEGTKADAIVRSASGGIASYDDGGDLPMKSLKVNIVPKQSGTGDPSPDNVRPISGTDEVGVFVRGKNLFEVADISNDNWDGNPSFGYAHFVDNLQFKKEGNGISWNAPSDPTFNWIVRKIKLLPEKTYSFSFDTSVGNKRTFLQLFDESGNNISSNSIAITGFTFNTYFYGYYKDSGSVSFTIPSACAYAFIGFGATSVTTGTNTKITNIMLEYGSTPSDYVPYEGETITKTLPQTVYGGTLDVVSGKLVVDRAMVNLGSLDWYKGGEQGTPIFYAYVSNMKSGISLPFRICSHYDNAKVAWNLLPDNSFTAAATDPYLYIRDSNYNDSDTLTFKTAMNGVQFAFEMANATEIDLTPTEVKSLLGDNNVWSDSGTVEVEYRADTSLVINKILEALA